MHVLMEHPNLFSFFFVNVSSWMFHVFIILFFICHMELPIIIRLCAKNFLMVVSYRARFELVSCL